MAKKIITTIFIILLLKAFFMINDMIIYNTNKMETKNLIEQKYGKGITYQPITQNKVFKIFQIPICVIYKKDEGRNGFMIPFEILFKTNFMKGLFFFDAQGKFNDYAITFFERNNSLKEIFSQEELKKILIRQIIQKNVEFNPTTIKEKLMEAGFNPQFFIAPFFSLRNVLMELIWRYQEDFNILMPEKNDTSNDLDRNKVKITSISPSKTVQSKEETGDSSKKKDKSKDDKKDRKKDKSKDDKKKDKSKNKKKDKK